MQWWPGGAPKFIEVRPLETGVGLLLPASHNKQQAILDSLRFYTDATAKFPGLAEDLEAGYRYNAAKAAVITATTPSLTAGITLNDQQRQELRKSALVWLQADLASWSKRVSVDGIDEKDLQAAQEKIIRWKTDAALANVRSVAVIAKLPAAERQFWGEIWKKVDILVSRLSAQQAGAGR
jgi:hypothetical protein